MYGNTECGICKTAFDNSIPVDKVLDIPRYDEDSDEEDEILQSPPCICYLLCVHVFIHSNLITLLTAETHYHQVQRGLVLKDKAT